MISHLKSYGDYQSKTRAFSASTDAEVSSMSSITSPSSNAINDKVLHTVMVHRNKQSLAFREGTPLIFTGSIAATYTEVCGGDYVSRNDGTLRLSVSESLCWVMLRLVLYRLISECDVE